MSNDLLKSPAATLPTGPGSCCSHWDRCKGDTPKRLNCSDLPVRDLQVPSPMYRDSEYPHRFQTARSPSRPARAGWHSLLHSHRYPRISCRRKERIKTIGPVQVRDASYRLQLRDIDLQVGPLLHECHDSDAF